MESIVQGFLPAANFLISPARSSMFSVRGSTMKSIVCGLVHVTFASAVDATFTVDPPFGPHRWMRKLVDVFGVHANAKRQRHLQHVACHRTD